MEKLKKKTQVGIFKNMGGNIPGGNFLGGNAPRGSLIGENFWGGSFPDTDQYKHSLALLIWPAHDYIPLMRHYIWHNLD